MSPTDPRPRRERLNLFQRLMLRWRELHPYNPVHVVRIAAALDLTRLQACVDARVQALGLTDLQIDARGRHLLRGGRTRRLHLQLVASGPDPALAVERAIERAFNEPFAGAEPVPLRGFVVAAEGGFHLGLAYDHFIAGGDAIARLLTDIALDYLGVAPSVRPAPAAASSYRQLLLRHPACAARALLTLPQAAAAMRRAHRPPLPASGDADDGFVYLRLDPASSQSLRAVLRRWGVTLNDALVAALMLAVAPLADARLSQPRRREIAIASIINVRDDFGRTADHSSAPYLAALRVAHLVPPGIGLEQLAREAHRHTAAVKRERRYLQSIFGLGLSALLWPMLSPPQRQRFYLKHHPVWAGVTTLNLNRLWQHADPAATARLDYLRGVPTGPLCPLVLAATTAHDVLHLGLAYRRAAFTSPDAAAIVGRLGQILGRAEGEARPMPTASAPAAAETDTVR